MADRPHITMARSSGVEMRAPRDGLTWTVEFLASIGVWENAPCGAVEGGAPSLQRGGRLRKRDALASENRRFAKWDSCGGAFNYRRE